MTTKFKSVFPDKNSLLTVIHVNDIEQTISNVKITVDSNLHWVFLINHNISWWELIEIFKKVRERFNNVWIWMNLLDLCLDETIDSVWILEKEWYKVDWLWVDNPQINWVNPWCHGQDRYKKKIEDTGWMWLYFWGVAFKYQPQPHSLEVACTEWSKYLDVITTSWDWTGKAADINKIKKMRSFAWNHPLWIASWTDSKNIVEFGEFTDIFLASSSLNKAWDFFNLDSAKTEDMGEVLRKLNGK